MRLVPIPVCRAAYRGAYAALRGYWFLLRPEVRGVKCVLTEGELVLLVRHTYGHREWDLPGGSVRRGEDPARAATREMHEELGVSVDSWTDLGSVSARIDHRRDTMHCYAADISGQRIVMDPCELATVRWFPRGRLPDEVGRFVARILALGDKHPTPGDEHPRPGDQHPRPGDQHPKPDEQQPRPFPAPPTG